MRLPEVIGSIVASLVALGCARAALRPNEPTQGHAIEPGRDGFYQLEARYAAGKPRILVAQSPDELRELWRDLRLPMQPPVVNFGEHLVIGVRHGSDCMPAYVRRLVVTASHQVHLEVLRGNDIIDEHLECWGSNRAYVLAIAVARRALPTQFEFFAPGMPSVTIAQEPSETTPGREWISNDPSPAPKVAHRHVPRPKPGEPEFVLLDDGTPVWAVAHADGGFSVLSALHRDPVHYFAGVNFIHGYDPQSGLFLEWDEYGVNAWTMRENLGRYAVAIDPRDSTQLVVGEPVAASHRSVAVAARGPYKRVKNPELPGPVLSFDQARGVPEGHMVLVDAQLFLDADGACLRKEASNELNVRCGPESMPVIGVKLVDFPRTLCTIGGPVLARVQHGGFSDVARLGSYIDCQPMHNQVEPAQDLRRRMNTVHGVLGTNLDSVLDSGHVLALGSDVRAGLEYHFWVSSPKPSDRLSDALLGDAVGVGARVRIASGLEHGRLTTVALLSLMPWVQHRERDFRLPTLLTALLPEPGLMVRSDGPVRFFLGSSLPISYGIWEWLPSVAWTPSSGQVLFTTSFGVLVQQ